MNTKAPTQYGRFDDANRTYVVTSPTPPGPWINYLGNRRLQAFVSQNAGGLLWYYEPESRRITRYQYTGAPADRPGFYVYVKDLRTGDLWNPHFAPTCAKLDTFECRHRPGTTGFVASKNGIEVVVDYVIPPADDVLVYRVRVTNRSATPADLRFSSYIEFAILEMARELWWAYIQRTITFKYDAAQRCIRYEYLPFEAAFSPCMAIGCSRPVSGFDASREAFMGRGGSLERPGSLGERGFSGSELPLGGHGCGALATDVSLAPGATEEFAYVFAIGDTDAQVNALLTKYYQLQAVREGFDANQAFWEKRLGVLTAATGDEMVDRSVNTWNAYQALTIAGLPCSISSEHMGIDGLRYRDTTQYCLTPAHLDPEFVKGRMDLVFASQHPDGMGSYIFRPFNKKKPDDSTRRSDNTVWQIYTVKAVVEETGDLSYLDHKVPYRDGSEGTVYGHVLRGLEYLQNHRGPHGLPLMYYADWNDCLVWWIGEETETVMLGMQLAYSCQQMAEVADRLGRSGDAQWCRKVADEQIAIINSDKVWDGQWYRRLLMGGGKYLGGANDKTAQLWINPQTWSVLCGAGDFQNRGAAAMEVVHQRLDSPLGLVKQDPPVGRQFDPLTGKPMGAPAGVGENGGIFNHTNTWAIMAETMLGHNERAFEYYRRAIPAVVAEYRGQDHYAREPYCYVSAVVGPTHPLFGQGGISWTTGTSSWMYIAATQYLLGIRPTLDGLSVRPCLPASMKSVRVKRIFRGCTYDIEIDNAARGSTRLEVSGKAIEGTVVPVQTSATCKVRCVC